MVQEHDPLRDERNQHFCIRKGRGTEEPASVCPRTTSGALGPRPGLASARGRAQATRHLGASVFPSGIGANAVLSGLRPEQMRSVCRSCSLLQLAGAQPTGTQPTGPLKAPGIAGPLSHVLGPSGHTEQKGESQATPVVHGDQCHDRRMYREGQDTQRW